MKNLKTNKMRKIVYNPEFDRIIFVDLKEGTEQKIQFSIGEKTVSQNIDSLALLLLIEESVVIGDL